jgi:bacillithiol system protein YtxJ
MINWIQLNAMGALEMIAKASSSKPQVIFKHSTRCSISVMAKSRLEKSQSPDHIDFHYLDLLNNRDISNQIAERYHVHHESPQILLIKNGECLYSESHNAISMEDIIEQAN